jgi:hypothetical protein
MVIIEVTRIGRAEKPQSLKDGDSALPCYYGNWNAPVPFMGRTLAMYSAGASEPIYFDHPNAFGSEAGSADSRCSESLRLLIQIIPV